VVRAFGPPVCVGAYAVPRLEGWRVEERHDKAYQVKRRPSKRTGGKPRVFQMPAMDEVKFTHTIGGAAIRVRVWAVHGLRNATYEEIARGIGAADTMLTLMPVNGDVPREVRDRKVTFLGQPALLRVERVKSEGYGVTDGRSLHWPAGRCGHSLDVDVRTPDGEVPRAARATADAAWGAITEGMRPTP